MFVNELNRFRSAPCGLMKLSGNAVLYVSRFRSVVQFIPRHALRFEPLRVCVFGPVGLGMVRPMKDLVTIVAANFDLHSDVLDVLNSDD